MAISDMVRARVDGIPVNVPKSATSADLITAVGQNPNARNLVIWNDDDTIEYVPRNRKIKPKNDQCFITEISSSGG